MIQAYVVSKQPHEAIQQLQIMKNVGIEPNQHTYSVILSAVGDITNLQEGKQIYTQLSVREAHFKSPTYLFSFNFIRRFMEMWVIFLTVW